MTDNFWWAGATTLGTWIAAGIVAWYAWETKRLRNIAQDQLESSVAPLLLLASNPPTSFPVIREIDLTQNHQPFNFTIYNAGEGAALRGRLRTTGLVREDLACFVPGPNLRNPPEEHVFSPIPARTAVTISLPLDTLARISSGPVEIGTMWLEFELLYKSASGREYRTFVRTQSLFFDDPKEIQYVPAIGRSTQWMNFLQWVRQRGRWLRGVLTAEWEPGGADD